MRIIASLVATACLFMSLPAHAETPLPGDVVKQIYAGHDITTVNPKDSIAPGQREKWLSKKLIALIEADEKESQKNNEPGRINGDILYNAQDFEIKDFKIGKPVTNTSGQSWVPVSFKNATLENKLVFNMILEDGSWKVDDIEYLVPAPAWTLKGLLTEKL